jgi:di/tricarboxylate transporter
MPEGMTGEILLTLLVTVGALLLFMWNRFRVDVVGIIVMVTLILLGLVTPREGISGFANEAMITVAAMFVLSGALIRTGVVDSLAKVMARVAGKSELRLIGVTLLIAVPISAFLNNTPVVIVLMPVILGIARDAGHAPSRVLMPLSFGSQMGGTLTLIGTSTNLLVAGLILDLGMDRIRLFDITPPALVLLAVGGLYLLTVGRWITPVREGAQEPLSFKELRRYLTGLAVEEGSPLSGRSLLELRFAEEYGLEVVAIQREDQPVIFPTGRTVIRGSDLLLVQGSAQAIARVEVTGHLTIAAPASQPEDPGDPLEPEDWMAVSMDADLPEEQLHLAEIIVPPGSRFEGRTLRSIGFRDRYHLAVLAIQRHGEVQHEPVGAQQLEVGDILLVRGSHRALQELHRRGEFTLLGGVDVPVRRTGKMSLALGIMAGVILLAAFNVMPILVSAMLGVVAMFVAGCITPEGAYEEVDWMVLVLLGSIIPLGVAMQNTGTASFLAENMLAYTAPLGLLGMLAAFYLLTSLLTELISNNAAAVVLTPIAVAAGMGMEVSPLPFVVAVMFAASNAFMTPIGYQTNTFIYGPGGYRFLDYLRVGGPLNLLLVVVATFVIPIFFPF